MTTLTDFLKDWQQDALAIAYGEASAKLVGLTPAQKDADMALIQMLGPKVIVAWCPVCETRETRKAFTPYCSQICREAAERKELMDRR